MRRLGLLLGAALCFLVSFDRPAAAHGAGGVESTNFETTLDGLTPAVPGVRVRLVDTGNRIELRNDGPEVVVLGARGEPYLRIGPDGTFENRRSPAADANRQTEHGAGAPVEGEAGAPHEWRKLSDAPVARWHEHGTHWMAPSDPPEVESRPGERHVVIPKWEIRLQRGQEEAVVFGSLTWVPGPSPAPWFGLMGGAFAVVAALGLMRRWGRPLAAATALVLVADAVHAFSIAFSFAGGLGTHLTKLVTGSFYGIVGWALAAVAIRLLGRGKVDGLYAGVFAGLSMAVFGGLLDLATLSRSVVPSVLPTGGARLCVALTAGGGLGLAVACLLVIQRTPDARRVVGGADADGAQDATAGTVAPAAADTASVGGRPDPPG